MKSMTVRLPVPLIADVEKEAAARGLSKSDIVRERLEQGRPDEQGDRRLRAILEQSWAAHKPLKARKFSSRHKQRVAEVIRAKKVHRR